MDRKVTLRPHAPLMWVVAALMVGYAVAEAWGAGARDNFFLLIILSATGILGAIFCKNKKDKIKNKFFIIWRVYAFVAVAALGTATYAWREARVEVAAGQMTPREAEMVVEPRKTFALRSDSGREAGLGIIREAPEATMVGQTVNYHVRWRLEEPLEPRAWVRMAGVLAPNMTGEEAKGFDQYLQRSHIPWSLSRGEAIEIVKKAPPLWHGVAQLRQGAIDILNKRWNKKNEENNNGLLPAMVIGEKAELTKLQKENFVKSGTMHLVAISGLNVMAVAAVLWGLLRLTGMPRIWEAAIVVILLGVYALVAGGGASVMRAWGMVALTMTAWGLRRHTNLWAIVVLAALVSLIIEPLSWMHAGWRLSFGVVGGIVLGMGAIERWGILQRLKGASGAIVGTCVVSLVAGLSVAPMTAAYWGMVQPMGWVVNSIAVTLASAVTVLGTLSWLVAWIPGASATINELSYLILKIIDWAIVNYLKLPGAWVKVPDNFTIGLEVGGTVIVLGVFYIFSRWGWQKKLRHAAG